MKTQKNKRNTERKLENNCLAVLFMITCLKAKYQIISLFLVWLEEASMLTSNKVNYPLNHMVYQDKWIGTIKTQKIQYYLI